MNNDNKVSLVIKLQNFVSKNFKNLLIISVLIVISVITFQIINYYNMQKLKKTSINFFNSIYSDNIYNNLNDIKNEDNFFSTLSNLKLIEENNRNSNFSVSNELYKETINNKDINSLYKSSISAHASYALINATYLENTENYINDIKYYINNIDDDLESFFSIKNELEYLLIITELDLKKYDYKNNTQALEKYNSISESSLISSSVKERVKKIHEFQIYK